MAEIPEGGFVDHGQLAAWLDSLPQGTAVPFARVLASRAALRLLHYVFNRPENAKTRTTLLLAIQTLRANIIARSTSKFVNRFIENPFILSAKAAISAVSYFRSKEINESAFYSLMAARSAASAILLTDTRGTASSEGFSGDFFLLTSHAIGSSSDSSIFRSLDFDIQFLGLRDDAASLAKMPLWPEGLETPFPLDRNAFLALHPSFVIWLDWYESIAAGHPAFDLPRDIADALEERIARGDGRGEGGEKFWDRPVDVINNEIAGWVEAARYATALRDFRPATRWQYQNGVFRLDGSGNSDDRDVTKDNVTRFQHEKAKERLKAFAERAKDIDDIYGWQGFGKSFEILYGLVNCDTNALPEQIAQLYDASIAFASFAHFDRDLQLAPSGNYAALNANDRRLFLEIVRTVAPWIRRFPTARNLDDETGQFLFKINDTAAHSEIIIAASSASLITQSDRDLILQLLAAIKRQGFPAEKAVKRGAFLTAGLFTVVGAVFGMTMDRMEPVQELAEFLASKGEQIFEVLGNEPADIQAAMRHMVDEARKQVGDAPTLPAPPRETPKLSTKRREKLQKHQG